MRGVAGEVAPKGILLPRAVIIVTENTAGVVALVTVGDRAAKSGHLQHLAAETNVANDEPPTDQPTGTKQRLDLLRVCIGRDVEILWLQTSQQITHATADQVGLKSGVFEGIKCLQRAAGQVRARNRMLGARIASGQ